VNADDRELVRLIRETLPSMNVPPSSLDLWPRFERRLDERRTRVGRVDWLMAALALGLLAGFPEVLMLLLYHL
jgi:hypothetical protein